MLKSIYRAFLILKSDFLGIIPFIALGLRRKKVVNPCAKLRVSLTTYRKRFGCLPYVLDSIISQDIKEDYSVVVHLSSQDFNDGKQPDFIDKYVKYGVEFQIHEENIKSYKKLAYEDLCNGPDAVITADDDVIYPSYWMRRLVETHKKHPECVVSYRAHFLKRDGDRKMKPYRQLMKLKAENGARTKPSFDLLPTGVSGVLYPKGSLNLIYKERDLFLKYAPSADDIWFKVASLINGIKCVQVEDFNMEFPFVPFSQYDSLNSINVGSDRNDHQLKSSFDLFPSLYEMIKE